MQNAARGREGRGGVSASGAARKEGGPAAAAGPSRIRDRTADAVPAHRPAAGSGDGAGASVMRAGNKNCPGPQRSRTEGIAVFYQYLLSLLRRTKPFFPVSVRI